MTPLYGSKRTDPPYLPAVQDVVYSILVYIIFLIKSPGLMPGAKSVLV